MQRRAAIYIRQSSPSQVLTNTGIQPMQYALRERATRLGWCEQDIEVIDADVGRSGATEVSVPGIRNWWLRSRWEGRRAAGL